MIKQLRIKCGRHPSRCHGRQDVSDQESAKPSFEPLELSWAEEICDHRGYPDCGQNKLHMDTHGLSNSWIGIMFLFTFYMFGIFWLSPIFRQTQCEPHKEDTYRMVDFTFPLQLKGTCLPQKKMFCPRFSILYGWDCIGIYLSIYIYDEAQSYLAGSLPPC